MTRRLLRAPYLLLHLLVHAVVVRGGALQRLPNVTSKPDGSGDANIVIRGLNAEGVTQPSRAAPGLAAGW